VALEVWTLSVSPAEGLRLRLAGEATVLAVVVGLYHSAFPPEPTMLTAGRRLKPLTGLSTVNSVDRRREGVAGVFVKLAIVGSNVVAMIRAGKLDVVEVRVCSRRLGGYARLYSAGHVTFLTPPSERMQPRTRHFFLIES
jgi:hypothetical protein